MIYPICCFDPLKNAICIFLEDMLNVCWLINQDGLINCTRKVPPMGLCTIILFEIHNFLKILTFQAAFLDSLTKFVESFRIVNWSH